MYDTTALVESADLTGESPLFVDIGGALGLDSARLLDKHPDLPPGAGLVVQDLPEVTTKHGAKEQLDPFITRMAHDFFAPQPLGGARACFVHAVPHDWPDDERVRIFESMRGPMTRGYSRLLIYKIVLPARSEENWGRLLGRSGLRVVGISRHPRAVESVIEAELS